MKTDICLHCGKSFESENGNSKYCPEEECQYEAKKKRQTSNYPIGNDAKRAIQKNYKLLQQLLYGADNVVLDLMYVLKRGFDHNGYYGSGVTTKTQKYAMLVHDIYFHITSDNPQKIEIWKISKK